MQARSVKAVVALCAFAIALCVGFGLALTHTETPAQAAAPARPPAQAANQPDAFEPNNTLEEAAAKPSFLPGSGTANLTFATATSPTSAQDDDWYIFALDPNRGYIITITAQAAGLGSLIAEIFDATGTNLQGTSGQVGNVSAANVTNGTSSQIQYRLRVQNKTTPPISYSYRIDWISVVIGAPTATPVGANPDVYEPNDSAALALANNRSFAPVGTTLQALNFYTNAVPPGGAPLTFQNGDVDWYFFYGRAGSRYQITTDVQPGVDTEMFLYVDCPSPNAGCEPFLSPPAANDFTNVGLLASSDDYQSLNRGSRIVFSAPYEGRYWLKLWNKDPTPRTAGQTYNLNVVELTTTTTTVTGTLAPPPTPYPGGQDRFEYNGDFDTAATIGPGVKYDQLNFVPFQPPNPATVDNDFYRLPVKQGVYYTCETIDLAGGTDTNMIVYNQDRQAVGGNDDISEGDKALGKFGSRFTWLSGYTGFAYLLIGDVNPPRVNEAAARTYSLVCTIGIPATPTPTVNPTPPTAPPPPATPLPPEPTATPFPTPRPAQPLVVRPVDPASLGPTAQPTPTPRVLLIDVQAFLDYSRNNLLDPGEGISGAPVRLYDEQSGTPLGQAFTDGDGRVRFSITNDGPVRVSLPMFGYSTVVDSSPATVRVGIVPTLELPERIP